MILDRIKDGTAAGFATRVLGDLAKFGMGPETFGEVDHLCYRVESLEAYERGKHDLAKGGRLLGESLVNGRPIATYQLHAPVLAAGHVISLIELPAPKAGSAYPEGFEHLEVVVGRGLPDLLARYPSLPFDLANRNAAVNPDVSLRVAGGLVKFHEQSLARVIEGERAAVAARGKPWLAVLDFDDTLAVSVPAFIACIRQALSGYLGRDLPLAEVESRAQPTFPEFCAAFGVKTPEGVRQVVSAFQAAWPDHENHCHVHAGTETLLSCLRGEGARLVVWTARDGATTERFLARHGWLPLIDAIYAFTPPDPGKPVPPPALCERVRAATAVLIGDSRTDAEGAARLGIPFVQAAWVHRRRIDPALAAAVSGSPMEALRDSITCLRRSLRT